jgi:hypothetical protein
MTIGMMYLCISCICFGRFGARFREERRSHSIVILKSRARSAETDTSDTQIHRGVGATLHRVEAHGMDLPSSSRGGPPFFSHCVGAMAGGSRCASMKMVKV